MGTGLASGWSSYRLVQKREYCTVHRILQYVSTVCMILYDMYCPLPSCSPASLVSDSSSGRFISEPRLVINKHPVIRMRNHH